MSDSQRAVIILDEQSGEATPVKPLMLEGVLFCPILRWMREKLQANGVQKFLVVCGEAYREEAKACFLPDTELTLSDRMEDLQAFLDTDEPVQVLNRAVMPMPKAGPGLVYQVPGHALQEAWQERLTGRIQDAEMLPGWLPVYRESLAELSLMVRDRVVQGFARNGVFILDPANTYIDPRALIGAGTKILPGTIIQGDTRIGYGCTIGPNALIDTCVLGDGVQVNASQVYQSVLADGCDVGPYAHIRPNCAVGKQCHIGAFVQLKNCVLGEGTKMAHLTYVGDADVGKGVNFGCGTITTNYDGFQKHRCKIGDKAFIGCNTNLVSPVEVGDGAYIAAGTTVIKNVPADALAVGRAKQENKDGWAKRRRQMNGQES